MTETLTQLVGRINLPSGETPENGKISFSLADWDKAGIDIFVPGPVSFELTADGDLIDCLLQSTAANDREQVYLPIVTYWSRLSNRLVSVGFPPIALPSVGPVNFADLLQIPVTVPVAPDVLAQAIAAAVAAQGSAAAAAGSAGSAALDAGDADTARIAAQLAQAEAEAARDASFVNAMVYPDIATGRAAVADGGEFNVTTGVEVVRYIRTSSTTQTEIARYPQTAFVTGQAAARTFYADTTALLAATTNGQFGYVGTQLYKNNAGAAVAVVADETAELRKKISTAHNLTSVAGAGAAYTATSLNGDFAGVSGAGYNSFVLFRPNVTNTVTNPTLSVNGGTAYQIRGLNSTTAIGRLQPTVSYLLAQIGGFWRILNDEGNTNVIFLNPITGAGVTYAATSPPAAPKISLNTLCVFRPNVTNTGDCNLTIDGGASMNIRDADFRKLPAGALIANGYYIGMIAGAGFVLVNMRNGALTDVAASLKSANDLADITQARHLSMLTSPLVAGGRNHDRIYVYDSAGGFKGWCAGVGDSGQIVNISGAAVKYIDLRNLYTGATEPLVYRCAVLTKFVTEDKIYTASAGAIVRVTRFDTTSTGYLFEAANGTITLEVDQNDPCPARDLAFITSGQSLAERFLLGAGLYGLQFGLKDFAARYDTIWADHGATGSTGLVPAAGATYWWDPVTSTPGPAALNWDAVRAAKPVTQPAYAFGYHVLGQNDAGAMGTDATLTCAAYLASYQELIAWMRAQIGDPNWPIFISPVGRWEYNASPTDAMVAAVRWVELQLINGDANIHMGPWYYDLPTPHFDVHLGEQMQKYQGYRLAALMDNALNGGANKTGPYISGLVENSGTNWTIKISQNDATNPFYTPAEMDFIGMFGAGEDPLTATPATVITQSGLKVGNDWFLTITLSRDVSGGQLMWPYGALNSMRQGRFPVDIRMTPTNKGWGNHWPLKPFLGGAF